MARAYKAARNNTANAADALRRHLDVKKLSAEDVLAAVNQRRQVLSLPATTELTSETVLNAGAAAGGSQPAFNKETAMRDLETAGKAQAGFSASA